MTEPLRPEDGPLPLSQPWRGEALDLIYEVRRETGG